jgi:hypothetical protein
VSLQGADKLRSRVPHINTIKKAYISICPATFNLLIISDFPTLERSCHCPFQLNAENFLVSPVVFADDASCGKYDIINN